MNQVEKVIIKFDEKHVGHQRQRTQPRVTSQYPDCTAIEKVMFQYSLAKKSKNVSSMAKVIQFPLS